jgi:Mrp family chromosome partitioning ATPase
MSSGGAEAFRDALRRSLPIIVALMILGVIAVNALQQLRGPRYSASAQVLISSSQLSTILTGTQPAFTDPQRVQSTAQALAGSSAVYRAAAQGKRLGTADELRSATSVSSNTDDDILVFTSTAASEPRAVAIVNAVAAAFTRYRGNLSRSDVTQAMTRLQSALNALPASSAERTQLERQLERLRVLQSLNTSDASLVDPAASASQTSPAPLRDSLLGLSLGLVVALIAIAIREAIDTKVRSDDEVEEALGAPVLASIGSLPRGTRLVRYSRRGAGFVDSYALLAAQLSPEAIDAGGTLVIAITSALPGEGKTTTSANLAVALARRGQDVVLADFDFRKATLNDVFDVPSDAPGAMQVIDDPRALEHSFWHVPLERVLRGADGADGVRGQREGTLRLLPAGGTVASQQPGQPSDLAWLVRQLRTTADVVLLDTPAALLTSEMTEISRLVDAVVVVVRIGRLTQRGLRSLGRQARSWEADVAGSVLTDTAGETAGYAAYGAR